MTPICGPLQALDLPEINRDLRVLDTIIYLVEVNRQMSNLPDEPIFFGYDIFRIMLASDRRSGIK